MEVLNHSLASTNGNTRARMELTRNDLEATIGHNADAMEFSKYGLVSRNGHTVAKTEVRKHNLVSTNGHTVAKTLSKLDLPSTNGHTVAKTEVSKHELSSTNGHTVAKTEVRTHELSSTNGHTAVVPQANRMNGAAPHLLMVPYPVQPHMLPMLGLARQIASHGGIKITYVSFQTLIDRLLKSESNLSDSIEFVGVPDGQPDAHPPSQLPGSPVVRLESGRLVQSMEPLVAKLLEDQHNLRGPTCMITDGVHSVGLDLGTKLGIPKYTFCASPAVYLQILLNSPQKGYISHDKDGFIRVPGVPPLHVHDLPQTCRNGHDGEAVLGRWRKCGLESDGFLVNTCAALEAEVIDALQDYRDIPVLPLGPLGLSPGLFSESVSLEGLQLSDGKPIIDWLSKQPPLSVLYVSFGTTGVYRLGKKHITELARGLEASGQRFVWVFRAPPGVDENDPELLPEGFEERVKHRGLLVKGWAPQLKILGHPSTGAFLTSCGWNSATESISVGVPMIGWPSFADQPIIARYLEDVLKVAVLLPQRENYLVQAEDFAKAMNAVLQTQLGKSIRERIGIYRTNIGADLAPGGSSYNAIFKFVNLIKGAPEIICRQSYQSL